MKYQKIIPLLVAAAVSATTVVPVSAQQMPEYAKEQQSVSGENGSDASGVKADEPGASSNTDQTTADQTESTSDAEIGQIEDTGKTEDANANKTADANENGTLDSQEETATDATADPQNGTVTDGQDAVALYDMTPFTYSINYNHVSQASIGGIASSDILKQTEAIIIKNEGSYGTVVLNDNGALSIGKMQWHANRAADLMKLIVSQDNTTAYNILGDALYNEIVRLNGNNAWASRVLTSDEGKRFSQLLVTDAAKRVQDDLMDSDVAVCINHAYANGLRNAAAVVYSADIENQCGPGGATTCTKEATNLVGDVNKVTLNEFHIASVCYGYHVNAWSKNTEANRRSFTTRRINTYVAASGYGWTFCNTGDQRMPSTSPRKNGIGTAWLQNALNRLQNAGLTVDGQYGSGTKTAVTNFQKSVGLSADGDAGVDTIGALINAMYADCAVYGDANRFPTYMVPDIVYDTNSGRWIYTVNGQPDYSYTGVAYNSNGWWRVEKGIVNFNYNGVAYNENGWWYIRGGQVDFSYTGLAENENGWWYIQNGKVDFTYNGFAGNTNGWWYVDNGQVTFKKNSVLYGKVNGKEGWWHVVNSKVTYDTTVAENSNGWWYVKDGKVDFTYNGFSNNTKGWWYVDNGQVTFGKNSVISGKVNGKDGWWHVKGSQVIYDTTVAENANGWWRIENGKVNFNFTGLAANENGWWYLKGGKVDFSYNGIAKNENGQWYVKDGRIDFTYSGTVTFGQTYYVIKYGKVESQGTMK